MNTQEKQTLRLVSQAEMPAIRIEGVNKTFKKKSGGSWFRPEYTAVHALKSINLEVPPGAIQGVLGANGSGKSTLIRIMSTLMTPDSGLVELFGFEIGKDDDEIRRFLNRVSVDAAFYKKLSPRENLLYSARLYGLSPTEAEERSLAILSRLGVRKSAFYEPMEEMSRGMQQKVAITRALLACPKLLLLDEPTTGLDPKSRIDVQNFLLEVCELYGTTVILTTHDMPEAERLCDKIAFINEGEFVAEGTADELKTLSGPEATLDEAFIDITGKSITDE